MAQRSSPASSGTIPEPLEATRGALDRRWAKLTAAIGDQLSLSRENLTIRAEYIGDRVWAGFVGAACEIVERQRGSAAPVAPLSILGHRDFRAWLGFREIWDAQPSGRRFTFRSISLTVHFGYDGDPLKPQIFRSEWPGISDWAGAGMDFQSPGAGHPHWQFDVIESLRGLPSVGDESLRRLSEDGGEVEEFSPMTLDRDVISAIRGSTLERIHFASAAPWWLRPVDETKAPHHMNAPANEASLLRWTIQCIAYVKQELTRCELRP